MVDMSEKLTKLISEIQYMGGLESRLAEHLIANDVVPVVRCKDCKAANRFANRPSYIFCMENFRLADEDDFCSYGERKDNG